MRVLSITSEAIPLIKTGGLADVAGALPKALNEHDVDMRVLLPAYNTLRPLMDKANLLWKTKSCLGYEVRAFALVKDGIQFLLLDCPALYDREGGIYNDGEGADYVDNHMRFAVLSMAAAMIVEEGLSDGWQADILHAHDWQAGLAPTYLKLRGKCKVPSVLTIHNIAFQGWVSADALQQLDLPAEEFHAGSLEYWGQLSTLKAGLVFADAITTVSPTYAGEIKTPEFGMGLEGVLNNRSRDLTGILNGVDDVWSPAKSDDFLPYDVKSLGNKAKNRTALLKEFSLPKMDGPLAIVVSRLTDQKGIDLLIDALPSYFARRGGLCLLGSGAPDLEIALHQLRAKFPDQFGLRIGYDEALSKRMFAGADAVLVPSRFEPCGLTQLYGLRFGTLPVVANTGGLADTVINANTAALQKKTATGIVMTRIDTAALMEALNSLIDIYAQKRVWKTMQKNAMIQVVDWSESARVYYKIYSDILNTD